MHEKLGILFPMAALAALTFAMLLLIPVRRFRAGAAGLVDYDDFRYGESLRVPPEVALPNRNMMNLLELPVLFYVACLAHYATDRVNAAALGLAWSYVALRAVHSAIHVTYNRVRDRLLAFGASNVVLVMLWTNLLRAATS